MKVLTNYEVVDFAGKIMDRGHAREQRATYDIRKKAKMGESFSGDISTNHRVQNQGKQKGYQTGIDSVSLYAYKPPSRQSTQRSSISYRYYSSRQMYATIPSFQTCDKSHIEQCHVLIGECFQYGQLGHCIKYYPRPSRNVSKGFGQLDVPIQATHNTIGIINRG